MLDIREVRDLKPEFVAEVSDMATSVTKIDYESLQRVQALL